jgi:hypothetical protein
MVISMGDDSDAEGAISRYSLSLTIAVSRGFRGLDWLLERVWHAEAAQVSL